MYLKTFSFMTDVKREYWRRNEPVIILASKFHGFFETLLAK
jgi:hypothetical protein